MAGQTGLAEAGGRRAAEVTGPGLRVIEGSGLARVAEYRRGSRSERTWRAYGSDWRDFEGWCASRGVAALPAGPETVARYLSDLAGAGRRPSTLARRLASISVAHQTAGRASPARDPRVRETLAGVRRQHGSAVDRVRPLRVVDLRRACTQTPETMQGVRDRALLLMGYAGAFRRSELVALEVGDLDFCDQGVRVTLRRSKTDQEGEGTVKAIGYGSHERTCPVRALRAWLEAAAISAGRVFRSVDRHGRVGESLGARAVATVVKRAAADLGEDAGAVSGHSLRAGFVTDAYSVGVPEAVIMQQTGHRSRTVLGIYRREADLFAVNFSAKVGL